MTTYEKPLPNVENPAIENFWNGTKEHKLIVQKCANCGYHRMPPSQACPECLTEGDDWTEIRPTGVLYSFCTYHRALAGKFKEDLPYSVAYVHLDDGPTIIGTLLGDPETFVIDSRVEAVFDDVTPEVTLVRWRVVK